MSKFIDLTGQRFGRLTVIERVQNTKTGQTRWLCRCTCGCETTVNGHELRNGDTKSCGCLPHARIKEDLTGRKFNRWTVINREKNKGGQVMWKCICDCGNNGIVSGYSLRSGRSKSCGCLTRELAKKRNHKKHGFSNTRIYNIWHNIIERCCNKKDHNFKNYGGRGIKVCDEWLNKENGFMNFYNWSVSHGYRKNLTIDRKNVNGDYNPINCRWATAKQQARNRRNNKLITYKGETKTLTEWCEIYGISGTTVNERLKRYWSIEKAFETPTEGQNIQYTYKGESKTMSEWASIYDLPYDIVKARLNQYHWPIEEVLNTPIGESKRHNRMITYKSITKSLPEWSKEYNITCKTLWRRLFELKWPVERALTTPKRKINKTSSKCS